MCMLGALSDFTFIRSKTNKLRDTHWKPNCNSHADHKMGKIETTFDIQLFGEILVHPNCALLYSIIRYRYLLPNSGRLINNYNFYFDTHTTI